MAVACSLFYLSTIAPSDYINHPRSLPSGISKWREARPKLRNNFFFFSKRRRYILNSVQSKTKGIERETNSIYFVDSHFLGGKLFFFFFGSMFCWFPPFLDRFPIGRWPAGSKSSSHLVYSYKRLIAYPVYFEVWRLYARGLMCPSTSYSPFYFVLFLFFSHSECALARLKLKSIRVLFVLFCFAPR